VEIVGNGDVTLNDIVTCEAGCNEEFYSTPDYVGMTLTATAEAGWTFDHWESSPWDRYPSLGCIDGTSSAPVLELGTDSYSCKAVFVACAAQDSEDLSVDPAGDPSLDILCVSTGLDTAAAPWLMVDMVAPWPPPEVYSWYTTVVFHGAAAEIGSYTVELHDGVMSIITTGSLNEGNTAFSPNPGGHAGYLLELLPALADSIERATVETGIQKSTDPGEFRMDGQVVVDPFVKEERDPPG
jgi:hypothetical protein